MNPYELAETRRNLFTFAPVMRTKSQIEVIGRTILGLRINERCPLTILTGTISRDFNREKMVHQRKVIFTETQVIVPMVNVFICSLMQFLSEIPKGNILSTVNNPKSVVRL